MRILLATRNDHKAREISQILACPVTSLNELRSAPEIVEDAGSFAGNATKKAAEIASWLRADPLLAASVDPATTFILADDSGLEVDALGGDPGVFSARFAGQEWPDLSRDEANNRKLLAALKETPAGARQARFRCVLALTPWLSVSPEPASRTCLASEFELMTELFEGSCEGSIGWEPRGAFGFGYDPIFIPAGFEQTLGELPAETKNRISHRGKALAKLKDSLGRRKAV